MPIRNYSVLKGDPTEGHVVDGRSAHYQITTRTDSGIVTVAVNIQSYNGSEVLYSVDHAFVPPNPDALIALPSGITHLDSSGNGLALDYVREKVAGSPMVDRNAMTLLSTDYPAKHRHNDLHNEVVDLLNRTIADANGTIYAFGSSYSDPGREDGIHDIHMNQGNPRGSHDNDNGIWQDGALFVNLPSQNAWIAIFIAFQSESWHTDDSGNPI
jgi:uncharacterized protein YukJ